MTKNPKDVDWFPERYDTPVFTPEEKPDPYWTAEGIISGCKLCGGAVVQTDLHDRFCPARNRAIEVYGE